MWRSLGLGRHDQLALAGGTLNLMSTPKLVTFDILPAMRAAKLHISHNFRPLTAGARVRHHQVGAPRQRKLSEYKTPIEVRVKEMRFSGGLWVALLVLVGALSSLSYGPWSVVPLSHFSFLHSGRVIPPGSIGSGHREACARKAEG